MDGACATASSHRRPSCSSAFSGPALAVGLAKLSVYTRKLVAAASENTKRRRYRRGFSAPTGRRWRATPGIPLTTIREDVERLFSSHDFRAAAFVRRAALHASVGDAGVYVGHVINAMKVDAGNVGSADVTAISQLANTMLDSVDRAGPGPTSNTI